MVNSNGFLSNFNFFKSNDNLIVKFNPLQFNSNTIFSKDEKFFFDDLKLEYLDVNHSNYLVFTKYSNVCKSYDKSFFDDLGLDNCIFNVTPNIFGREYSKTCSYRVSKYGESKSCLFEVLCGEGFFILEDNLLGDVVIVKVKLGDYVLIEERFSFVLVNSSKTENLTVFSLFSNDCRFEKGVFENFNGANLFYTVTGFIKNLNSNHSYNLENFSGDFIENYNFDREVGLYKESLLIPEKFNFLK
jgi:hypothetical protein